ncbi:MAG: heme ABC transporter permease CcmB [Coriobacteriia bacterium]|nr:heme ABC transporter permease CcmB [Coriobacteriia bacterium]
MAKISSARQFKAILRKDLVMELRTREMLTSMGLYAVLVLVVYEIALSQAGSDFEILRIASGLLWLAIIFTSLLGLNRSLVHEKDQGCLEALLLSPIDRPVIYFAKAIGNLIFLAMVEVIVLPLFYFFFLSGKELGAPLWMLPLPLIVGSIGIAGVGTLLSTMSVNTTGKDFILAVLFIPVMFPLLYACVAATSAVLIGDPGYAVVYWKSLALGAGYDGIMILAAFGLYEFIIGA